MFTKLWVIILFFLPVIDMEMDIGQCDTRGSQSRGFRKCSVSNFSSFSEISLDEISLDGMTTAAAVILLKESSATHRDSAVTPTNVHEAFCGIGRQLT